MPKPHSYKPLFSRFLSANPDLLHFAAHSHHFWPDVSHNAHMQYWEDSAQLSDEKWGLIFGEYIPKLQNHIAGHLKLSKPENIAIAPNTHEFVLRLLSCLPTNKPPRILTTDSEFHSFNRQTKRLEEDGLIDVIRVPTEPFADFSERFCDAMTPDLDMIFISQVFFNSGFAMTDIEQIVSSIPNPETLCIIDGYHGFMAIPADLSAIEERAFYMAGGYKYAMSGENICFMHVPDGYAPRPRNTGWYAAFGALGAPQDGHVPYGADGSRFMGATFDPSGIYRMNAVMDMLAEEQISVDDIHSHVLARQEQFIADLPESGDISQATFLPIAKENRGHFLTFRTNNAEAIHQSLKAKSILTDYRNDRLRFGFALYHDPDDIEGLSSLCFERAD